MKKNVNFRKILALIGVTSFLIPTSLNVIACGTKAQTDNDENIIDNVIESINNIEDLKINITENETSQTIINILNSNKGISYAITKYYIDNFDEKLFNIDCIYTDSDREHKVSEDDIIKLTTYYFQFTYAEKNNKSLVQVQITSKEKDVVKEINQTNYDIDAIVKTKVSNLEQMINFNFVKKELNENVQAIFNDSLFHLNQITTIKGEKIIDQDLIEPGLISAQINYNYGTIVNQTTNLKIIKNFPMITKGEFVKLAEERSETNPMIFTIKIKKPGNYNYLPIVLKTMRIAIYEEFLNVYSLRIDINKLKMTDIQSDEQVPTQFDDNWFIDVKKFNAIGSADYDGLSTGPINIIFDVITR